jgi:23S rRNA (uracil1939-C5)-methyltransferase
MHVFESLQQLAQVENPQVLNPIPSQQVWGYRNKMEFSFADRRWLLPEELEDTSVNKSFALGMHVAAAYDKILDIDHCMLQSAQANAVLNIVDDYCIKHKLEPYGIKSHQGYLRYLVIRQSHYNGELLVNLVTAYHDEKVLSQLVLKIIDNVPQVTTIVNNINPKKAQIAVGIEEFILFGKGFLTERLGGFEFRVSANSFFQTNTVQAEKLYRVVLDYADLKGNELVWDLYCGTGTITMFLSRYGRHVFGYELNAGAVNDAIENARVHQCTNTSFIAGDLLKNIMHSDSVPDVIVTDPPRSGMHPKVCEALLESGAHRIVYVSCNPTTMARDINMLLPKYKLIKAQPVDMFPHTYHIETVVLLELK